MPYPEGRAIHCYSSRAFAPLWGIRCYPSRVKGKRRKAVKALHLLCRLSWLAAQRPALSVLLVSFYVHPAAHRWVALRPSLRKQIRSATANGRCGYFMLGLIAVMKYSNVYFTFEMAYSRVQCFELIL